MQLGCSRAVAGQQLVLLWPLRHACCCFWCWRRQEAGELVLTDLAVEVLLALLLLGLVQWSLAAWALVQGKG
jgi:hypothetical protein